jgi:hypothetical protein
MATTSDQSASYAINNSLLLYKNFPNTFIGCIAMFQKSSLK